MPNFSAAKKNETYIKTKKTLQAFLGYKGVSVDEQATPKTAYASRKKKKTQQAQKFQTTKYL